MDVKLMERCGFSLCLASAALFALPAIAADVPLVGMLELQSQCKRDEAPGVRALFARSGSSWISLVDQDIAASYDMGQVDWTVTFDGRTLGTVRTIDAGIPDRSFRYDRDYRLTVVEDQTLPTIANRREEFGGWCEVPDARPLVVNSHSNFHDPDGWEPFAIGDGYRELLYDAYMGALGEVPRCYNLPDDHELSAVDLAIHKAYRDAAGRQLVALRLLPNGEWCDDGYGISPIVWFAIADTFRHVGNDLELIDAGDYDGDGESEIIFWHSAYNQDGYMILYDGLRWSANYHWGYH